MNWLEPFNKTFEFIGERSVHNREKRKVYENPLGDSFNRSVIKKLMGMYNPNNLQHMVYNMIDLFISGKQSFNDLWHVVLPSDNDVVVDPVFDKTQFTEVWLPVDQTNEVIDALKVALKNDPLMSGPFAIEIYGAKKSEFWLSCSYGYDVIRIDPYWYSNQNPKPKHEQYEEILRNFFTKYWEILLPMDNARCHWGKWMPRCGQILGQKLVYGQDFLKLRFEKLGDFLKLREKLDPKQVFVTPYWRELFGISEIEE